jgi:hypothetical protein
MNDLKKHDEKPVWADGNYTKPRNPDN